MKKHTASFIFILFIISLLVTGTLQDISRDIERYPGRGSQTEPFNEGWYYLDDKGEKIPITLPYRQDVDKNEIFTIYHLMEESDRAESIYFASANEWIKVYSGSRLIYERETYQTNKNKNAPTNGNNYVEIPRGTGTLAIEVSSPYKLYGGNISAVTKGSMQELRVKFEDIYLYFMDIVIFLCGFLLLGYCIYLKKNKKKEGVIFWLGILAFVLGGWLRTGTYDLEFRYLSAQSVMEISYLLWFFIPIVLAQLMRCYSRAKYKKYTVLLRLAVLNAVCNIVLQIAGICDYIEIIQTSHILLAIMGIVLIADVVMNIRKKKLQDNKIQIIGALVFAAFALMELIQYYTTKLPSGIMIRLGIVCCIILLGLGEYFRILKAVNKKLEEEADRRKTQLQITLSQLQPHFIFNALGAIRIMIHTDKESAYDMLYDFSKFLRASLGTLQEEQLIPFSQELSQIKAYLNIERKRFDERITAEYEIETEDFMIPALTAEPLVVNAVGHGLRKGKDSGTVTVKTKELDKSYVIVIKDDGIGFDVQEWEKEVKEANPEYYMGIPNIRKRLMSMPGAKLTVESMIGKGTVVTIEIPKY